MSNYLILAENDISDWGDQTGITYHFPRRYYDLVKPGTKFIYYNGSLKDKAYRDMRLSDDPHYFGMGTIGEVIEDKANLKRERAYFAEILDYKEFEEAVSFKNKHGYLEPITEENKGNYFRKAVRPITIDLFNTIIGQTSLKSPNLINSKTDGYDSELESEEEGKSKKRYVTYYERSGINRQKAIEFHGLNCRCCGFNFESKYGDLGKGFIHVHHIIPISVRHTTYKPNIEKDFAVLCPNCHSMVHRNRNKTLSIHELRLIIEHR